MSNRGSILVTGGAGYIGSHACKSLHRFGYRPIVVDNLSYGHEWAVKWGPLYRLDIRDTSALIELLKEERVEAVVHFAAYAYVGESVSNPMKYYENNVLGSLSLFRAMSEAQVRTIVFSSTCATYGLPEKMPIAEESPQSPINPYGESKLMVEKILKDLGDADGLQSVSLRYFNAAGADGDSELGEDHEPETHLIPLAIRAAFDDNFTLTVFGSDYPTADGTCVRDYIHVTDLALAHVKALKSMSIKKEKWRAYNLGAGTGHSVLDVIKGIEQITGRKVKVQKGSRRPGDPPQLVAIPGKARIDLDWEPIHSSLENILQTAVRWYERHSRASSVI